jgi:hypothetical protein
VQVSSSRVTRLSPVKNLTMVRVQRIIWGITECTSFGLEPTIQGFGGLSLDSFECSGCLLESTGLHCVESSRCGACPV